MVVSGPSGAGKSTIVDALRRRIPIGFSVSATTRSPRPGELDGIHYHFIDRSRFEELVEEGAFLEWAAYGGNLYGTLRSEVDGRLDRGELVLLEIEIQGARQVRAIRPDAFLVFVAPPSLDELERRLRGRGDTPEPDIDRRLDIARVEMAEAPGVFDVIVVNDDVDLAVAEVLTALRTAGAAPGSAGGGGSAIL